MIELVDWSDQLFVATYEHFEVGSEQDYFRLSLSDNKYAGNASKDVLDDIYYGKGFFFLLRKYKKRKRIVMNGKGAKNGNSTLLISLS